MIAPPRLPTSHADRSLECQEALESRVIALVDEGKAAGWSTAEMTLALIALADNLMLADAANEQTRRDIDEALKRLGL